MRGATCEFGQSKIKSVAQVSSTVSAHAELRLSWYPFRTLHFQRCYSRSTLYYSPFPAVIVMPGNLAAWDATVWNVRRKGSMHATRWEIHDCRVHKIFSIGRISSIFTMLKVGILCNDNARDLYRYRICSCLQDQGIQLKLDQLVVY